MRAVRAPLDVDRQRLAEAWMPRAIAAARRWARARPWLREEFASEALLGLVEAAATYESGKGSFVTHLHWGLIRARTRALRSSLPLGWRHETSPGESPALHGGTDYGLYVDPLSADPALVAMAGELAGRA